ncbi:hypothetical protein PRIPAC_73699 [Pristionchus pacificus]|uniref:ShK domain-containing protein n=1 Tax=Pristionchus pacificus TaxID=54126 RepID=A0A454XIN3_PRIPA|nr:hypothetical protein PRIPAC_73699 [Pristionchus pacificus]|eukprot:PDM71717.1 ShK domain-containing protein [Pristionchus pacificus]
MQLAATTVVLFALVSSTAAQCTGSDHPNCKSWKTNGYCTNAATPLEQRKLYCGVTCGLCNTDGTQTAAGGGSIVPPCTDANPSCATWQTQTPPFCANPSYSEAMKKQYCCKTCSTPVPPTTACAAIYAGTDATTPLINSAPTTDPLGVAISTLDPVNKVVVKTGCTLILSSNPQGGPITPTGGSPIVGDGNFKTITIAPPDIAMAFTCTC